MSEKVAENLDKSMIVNPKYERTDRGEFLTQMLDELAESERHVSSKSPESSGDWTLLHDRDEAKDPENFYCWRKNTGSKTEMFTKAVMYIKGVHPINVVKAMSLKIAKELDFMRQKGPEAFQMLEENQKEHWLVCHMKKEVKKQKDRDFVTKMFTLPDGIMLPQHGNASLGCGCRFSVEHAKKPEDKSDNIRGTMKELWFVIPDPKGSKLIWLTSTEYGGEPNEEEFGKLQPAHTKVMYCILHKIIASLKKAV